MTVRFPSKICKNLLLRINMQSCVIAAIFGYTLSAMKLTHKPLSTFKTVMLNGAASNALKILSPFQSFQINSYLKLTNANKIKFKAIRTPLPSEHSLIEVLNSIIDDTNSKCRFIL